MPVYPPPSGGGGISGIVVQEADGNPTGTATTLVVSNTTLSSVSGGTATLNTAGTAISGLVIQEADGNPTGTATVLVFPNTTLAISNGTATYTAASAGGSAVYTFPLDQPPGTAHAKDDEFTAGALDGKWTSPLSSGSDLGVTLTFVGSSHMTLEPTTSGASSTGKRMFGIRQAAPTGSFTISAKVATQGLYGSADTVSGIFVARTAGTAVRLTGRNTSGFGNIRTIGSSLYSETADTGAYDGAILFDTGTTLAWPWSWHKIVWDAGASTLVYHYSFDGVSYVAIGTTSSQSQPDRIGICLYSNSATVRADHMMAVDWFRVTE